MQWVRKVATRIRRTDDDGAALPLVAGILVVLLGLSAFAVDMGWLYLNSHRLQRAADSAALAGVVHLPGFPDQVTANASAGATANGFTPGVGATTMSWQAVADNRLEVTLATTVPTFLIRVMGLDTFDISRRATAEYIKPVPLGSPFTSFGDGNDSNQAFWASISGEYTAKPNGDAFNSRCDWSRNLGTCVDSSDANRSLWPGSPAAGPGDIDSNNSEFNPDYRRGGSVEGYYYGLEKTGAGSMGVQLYDPNFRRRQTSGGCSMSLGPGDCDKLVWGPPTGGTATAGTNGPATRFRLYAPDSTPLDPYDNSTLICDVTYPTLAPTTSSVSSWVDFCSTSGPEGAYVLRVTASGGNGINQYAIRVNGAGTQVFGINDISIFANANNATLYLAEILPVHAGKKLEMRFFDPGEGAGNASMTVRPANRPGGAANSISCAWTAEDSDGNQHNSGGSCVLPTTLGGVAQFNNYWVTVVVDIPSNYDCNPDAADPANGCWWRMDMNLNTPHDRTTWTARVIGNPIRLVANE